MPAAGRARAQRPDRRGGRRAGDLLTVGILDVGPILQEELRPRPARGGATPGCSRRRTAAGSDRAVPRRAQGDPVLPRRWRYVLRHVAAASNGIVHPGLMGTAPSAELLARWISTT